MCFAGKGGGRRRREGEEEEGDRAAKITHA